MCSHRKGRECLKGKRGEPMTKQAAAFVRTPPETEVTAQTDEMVLTTEQATAESNVRVIARYYQFSASFSIPIEPSPTPQELAFREKLRMEIERLETILADGTYTAEDQANARASLRAAGIIDEYDEIMPEYRPIPGEE